MKTVAIVPMKLNNRRLPQKNTKCFTNGKPLCHYILSTLLKVKGIDEVYVSVSYTHLRAHETGRNLVCRLLLEKKKKIKKTTNYTLHQ